MSTSDQKNVKTAVTLFAIAGGMIGLAFASVPLYQLFCQVTGYGGTTVNVATKPKKELFFWFCCDINCSPTITGDLTE